MPLSNIGNPGVAAITFAPRGGGIAAVSRLLQQVISDEGGEPCRTFTLAQARGSFSTTTRERLSFGARIAKAQATGECDWLFYTHLSLATVQGFLRWPIASPYAVFLHDVEAWTPLTPFRLKVLRGAFLRLANSHYTASRVAMANPGCGRIIPCPLALPRAWETGVAPAAGGGDSDTIVILGRMMAGERYKGHDQLLEVWPRVLAVRPTARLLCVGDGDDVARLRSKATFLGLDGHVVFTGFVNDEERLEIYRSASAFAMPSRREGFGLVYLEAMAHSLPCIGSIHDAASDVIDDGVTGFLVAQDDSPSLVTRIVQLLSDRDLRQRMGDAGRRRYLAEFTYEAFRRRVVSHIVNAGPGRPRLKTEATRPAIS